MMKNLGASDRIIRLIIAAVIVTLYMTGIVGGTLGITLVVLSAIFILTSFVGVCPLYLPFGFSTLRRKKQEAS